MGGRSMIARNAEEFFMLKPKRLREIAAEPAQQPPDPMADRFWLLCEKCGRDFVVRTFAPKCTTCTETNRIEKR